MGDSGNLDSLWIEVLARWMAEGWLTGGLASGGWNWLVGWLGGWLATVTPEAETQGSGEA